MTSHFSLSRQLHRLLFCCFFVLLLCSCKPKQVAVGYGDDVYYTETKSNKITSRPAPVNNKPIDRDKDLSASARALLDEAYSWVGTPYAYGGHSRRGTDCSGFVMEVYRRALDFSLPRSTSEQSEACNSIDRDALRPGDLVFFRHIKHGKINHVGIYTGNGRFLHASSSKGVIESDLEEEYYARRFRHAARIKGLKLK